MNLANRQSKTERALVATDARGRRVILATDGAWIGCDVENIGADAEDVGLVDAEDCPEPGLYLWEGVGRLEYENWEATTPTETVYDGTVRRVRPEEVEELYRMAPPAPKEQP